MEQGEEYAGTHQKKSGKQHNILPLWGNEATMNLNPLILANIQGSSYFKVHLFKLKTYHEVVDEIYYQVKHLEPWERGSRKTAGQTGMCGGVRGVGAGGIVSTAFCLLYKLYTLRLTRKQVNGLLTHTDSPYIRALGFMYIRYTQPPGDLYDWYQDYLLDEEEIDVKAGGGQVMIIGQMAHQFLIKLDWFSTLFPRIPVPIQKQIENKLNEFSRENNVNFHHLHQQQATSQARQNNYAATSSERNTRSSPDRERDGREERRRTRDDRGERELQDRDRGERVDREYYGHRDSRYDRSKSRERSDHHHSGERERERQHRKKHKNKDRERSRSGSKTKDRRSKEYNRERSSERYRERERDRRYH